MGMIHTAHGPGRVVASETVRGRTHHKVAGVGFEIWMDSAEVHKRTAGDLVEGPLPSWGGAGEPSPAEERLFRLKYMNDPREHAGGGDARDWGADVRGAEDDVIAEHHRHGAAPIFDFEPTDHSWDNSTTLPYNYEPQFPVDMFRHEQTQSPDHEIDRDERLRATNSVSGERGKERPYPGPDPKLFAKHAAKRPHHEQLISIFPEGSDVPGVGSDDLFGGGHSPADDDDFYDRFAATGHVGAGGLYGDEVPGSGGLGGALESQVKTLGEPGIDPASGARTIGHGIDLNPDNFQAHQASVWLDAADADESQDDPAWSQFQHDSQAAEQEHYAARYAVDYTTEPGGAAHDELHDPFGDSMAAHPDEMPHYGAWTAPAGLSGKYAAVIDAADHFGDPVQRFRDDPVREIQRTAHIAVSAGLDAETGQWMDLVCADKQIRTAAWKDVRKKAMRLRREGKVTVHSMDSNGIFANVEGDHGDYEVMILKGAAYGGQAGWAPGSQAIANWKCDCEWGKWAFKRKFSYVGRLCSHGYATYLTMQSKAHKKVPSTYAEYGTNYQHRAKPVRTSGIVDDFKAWCKNQNSDHIDTDAADQFFEDLDEPSTREDAEKVLDYVLTHHSERPQRNYDVDGYTFDPDKVYKQGDVLRHQPGKLVPHLYVVPDGEAEHFVDVEKDERKTTGPTQIMAKGESGSDHHPAFAWHVDGEDDLPKNGIVHFSAKLGGIQFVADDHLLQRLRDLSNEKPSYQHMWAHNQEVAQVVQELHDRGYAASPMVAARQAATWRVAEDDDKKKNGPFSQQFQDAPPLGPGLPGEKFKDAPPIGGTSAPLKLPTIKPDSPTQGADGGAGGLPKLPATPKAPGATTTGKPAPATSPATPDGSAGGSAGSGWSARDIGKDSIKPDANGNYTVQQGDTLSGIAGGAGVDLGDLEKSNSGPMGSGTNIGKNPDLIHPGDVLHLPGANPAGTGTADGSNPVPKGMASPGAPGGPAGPNPNLNPAPPGGAPKTPAPAPTPAPNPVGGGGAPKPGSVPGSGSFDVVPKGSAGLGLFGSTDPQRFAALYMRAAPDGAGRPPSNSGDVAGEYPADTPPAPQPGQHMNLPGLPGIGFGGLGVGAPGAEGAQSMIPSALSGLDAFLGSAQHFASRYMHADSDFLGQGGGDWMDYSFAGSGPNRQTWSTSSEDYVNAREGKDRVDDWAIDRNGDIIKGNPTQPRQARRVAKSFDVAPDGSHVMSRDNFERMRGHGYAGTWAELGHPDRPGHWHMFQGEGGGTTLGPVHIVGGHRHADIAGSGDAGYGGGPGAGEIGGGTLAPPTDDSSGFGMAEAPVGQSPTMGQLTNTAARYAVDSYHPSGYFNPRNNPGHQISHTGLGVRDIAEAIDEARHAADSDVLPATEDDRPVGEVVKSSSFGRGDDTSDVVRQFQASGGGCLAGASSGGQFSDDAIANTASRLLRTAGRHFSLDEQRALEEESHPAGARNLAGLDLRGTHYVD